MSLHKDMWLFSQFTLKEKSDNAEENLTVSLEVQNWYGSKVILQDKYPMNLNILQLHASATW